MEMGRAISQLECSSPLAHGGRGTRTTWHSPSLASMAPSERQRCLFAPCRICPGLRLFRLYIRHFDNHLREQARKGFYLIQGKSADSYEGEAPDDRMRCGRPHRTPRRLDPGPARPQWLRDTVPQGVHIVLSAPRMTGRSL